MAVLCLPDLTSNTAVTSRSIWSTCIILYPVFSARWKPNGCSLTSGEQFVLLRGFLQKELLGRTEGPSSLISPQQSKLLVFALALWQLSLWVWWSSCYMSNFCRLLLLVGLATAGWQPSGARRGNPACPFIRKQCLTYSVLCDHLLRIRLPVILLRGQRMSALEIRACTAPPPTFWPYLPLFPPSHIAPLQPGTPVSSNFWDSTTDSNTCLIFLAWTARVKGMWPEHSM